MKRHHFFPDNQSFKLLFLLRRKRPFKIRLAVSLIQWCAVSPYLILDILEEGDDDVEDDSDDDDNHDRVVTMMTVVMRMLVMVI